MSWDLKLKQLQLDLGHSPDTLASTLGITTRTLADFMKPVSEGGREPSGPVQKLIEHLLRELNSSETPEVAKKPRLNLVIIHNDFRVVGGDDPVDAIVSMHSEDGRQGPGAAQRQTARSLGINEFHYVAVAPIAQVRKYLIEGMLRHGIQPHLFATEPGLDSQEARDCYFTATAIWLASQAMRRDLGHITLAADAKKFWPLARVLKELAEVDVTFVRETPAGQDAGVEEMLRNIGIALADPVGRKLGFVTRLVREEREGNGYGFITLGHLNATGQAVLEDSTLFFSWNHMRKDRFGVPEVAIGKLVEGDYVSFSIGMNYQGRCATDVALVQRAADAPPIGTDLDQQALSRRSGASESDLVAIVKDAVSVCADEDGWALSSAVGSRITVLHPDFIDRLKVGTAHSKISQLARAHSEIFELSTGAGTRHLASCMRIKSASK